MAADRKTFRDLYCEKIGIPAAAFEETVLWECLPPGHLFIGKLLWRFAKSYFNPDLKLIRNVANSTSLSELKWEVGDYYYRHRDFGFERTVLRARLSGQRLVNFASQFLPPD